MTTTKKKPAKGKRRAKQQLLSIAITGPEVQKILGGVSHVTLLNLVKKGKLERIGGAHLQGGGFLYDSVQVKEFAKTYQPQRNPPPKKASKTTKKKLLKKLSKRGSARA